MKYLGETFDIHAGGVDLVFPHHENEIAQSEAATGHLFAKYWMHWGSVNSGGEKMSKSLGNFFTIRELREHYSASVLRLYVLGSHYRSPIEYSPERIVETAKSFDRIRTALSVSKQLASSETGAPDPEYVQRFGEMMDDDFNTAGAIGVVFEALSELNRLITAGEKNTRIADLSATITGLLSHLGIVPDEPETKTVDSDLSAQVIEKAIEWRKAARAAKQYGLSDTIRDDLKSLGILLEDRPQGTTWRKV
jgi:cysteinyl-tRNA synthetase